VQIELPIACRAHEIVLLEEQEEDGRWITRRVFPLA
jgi:hypothetical protein